MEAVKKYWFWGIFISILTIFAMSHNANAITPVFDIDNYDLKHNIRFTNLNCGFNGGTNSITTGRTFCRTTIQGTTALYSIGTENTYNIKNGDIVDFFLIIQGQTEGFSHLPKFQGLSLSNWQILNIKTVDKEQYVNEILSNNGYINSQPPNYDLNIDFYNASGFYNIYEFTLKSYSDQQNLSIGLLSSSVSPLFGFSADDIGQTVIFSIQNILHYEYVGTKTNKEQEEKTQEAVDESEAAGGSSSQDAQTGTTGLLNAITGAVTVISSASPTNCKINGNMGNLDMGQLDLCANPAPVFIQTIGSLILILMCVPLAISLFNRFIAIFRSFQS